VSPTWPKLSASCGRATQLHMSTDSTLARIIDPAFAEARAGGCDQWGRARRVVMAVPQVRDALPHHSPPPENMRFVMPLKSLFIVAVLLLAFGRPAISAAQTSNCDVSDKIDASSAITARTQIENAGFRQLHDLEKGCDNFWHGKAEKDGVAVNVVLTPQGNVMVEGN